MGVTFTAANDHHGTKSLHLDWFTSDLNNQIGLTVHNRSRAYFLLPLVTVINSYVLVIE